MPPYEYPGHELDVFAHAVQWKAYFAKVLRRYIGGDVLEVGAGLGETTRSLLNPTVRRWVCVEPDPALARRLAALQWNAGVKPEIVVGDIRQLPRTDHFDSILYIDVLEHIRSDAEELRDAAARLAPGGYLVVLSPAFETLYSEFDAALGHERRYTKRSLASVFPRDLERVALFYLDSLGMLLSLTNRMLLRQSQPTVRQILFWDRNVIPLSRLLDRVVARSFGRSIIAVYQRPMGKGEQ